VYKRVIEEDGSVCHTFPFLEKPERHDKELFNNISVVLPWSKKVSKAMLLKHRQR